MANPPPCICRKIVQKKPASLFRDRVSEVTKIIKHLFAVPELGVVSRNKFDIAAHILRSFFKEQTKSAQLQSLSSL